MARTLGLEPKPTVLETAMLPITPGPYMVVARGIEPRFRERKSRVLPLDDTTIWSE